MFWPLCSLEGNDLCSLAQLVQAVGSRMHHLATLDYELRAIVGGAERPALPMYEQRLDAALGFKCVLNTTGQSLLMAMTRAAC
ncbi:hypothetical protein [Variovorax boronicumulans]|uniref:hypothetical protein n=1 Tax=Variovorax boronicumulans TaxID=436515 RepID=UPI0012F72D65|nr:hypothetical protein [Variovorax boronicumulans]